MIAYKINPLDKEITKIDIRHSLENINKELETKIFDIIALPSGDSLYIIDEVEDFKGKGSFKIFGHIIKGTALIIGHNESSSEYINQPKIKKGELEIQIDFFKVFYFDWLKTMLDEKNISLSTKMSNGIALIQIVEQFYFEDSETKKIIKNKLLEIEINNGNLLHFFEFLSKRMYSSHSDVA